MPSLSVPLRLGILASHGGSNLQSILDRIAEGVLSAQARLVISNNSQAKALERARAAGVPALHLSSQTHPDADALDRAMVNAMREHGVELVVCAGYMRKVGRGVLAAFPHRVLNIHPALLPKFGGKGMYGIHVHEAVLAAGERETGVTIHLVDELYDHGLTLAQDRVPILPGDTPESVQKRVLEVEHRLYPETLRRIAVGEIDLNVR